MPGDLADGEGGELAAAQSGDEPDEQQGLGARPREVRLKLAAAVAPSLGGRAGVEDVEQVGRHQRGGVVG